MTIILNSTPISSSANSYISLEDADVYLSAHLQAIAWSELTEEQKKAALIVATRELDSQIYLGRRSTYEQALAWPRIYIYDNDGFVVNDIPQKIKAATCELAMWRLTEGDRIAGRFELENMDSVSIGPITYKVGLSAKGGIPQYISDLISSIGPNIVQSGSSTSVLNMVL